MQLIGKMVVVFGLVVVVVGLILIFFDKMPFLGKLPGDIHLKRENVHLFIPLTTSILISLLLSAILWIIFHIRGK
ncbi:MAG: DUF2905 family protein [Ignavibacteria bacterium]|nr:DUF2905 family protein [Ignavibacteria bacterium]